MLRWLDYILFTYFLGNMIGSISESCYQTGSWILLYGYQCLLCHNIDVPKPCFTLVPIYVGHSNSVDAASMMEGTRTNPGNRDHPASIMHPPAKRHKSYAFLVILTFIAFL